MTGPERSARNALTALSLDRASEARRDPEWLRGQLRRARLLPIWRGKAHIHHAQARLVWYPPEADADPESLIFLGNDASGAWFAWPLDDALAGDLARRGDGAEFVGIRQACTLLQAHEAGLLAYARALVHWHETARFCGHCGAVTDSREGGFLRVCTAAACKAQQFPRLDPAVIMRIEHDNRILLGRQAHWPKDQYSVLAGFVEPGESLEDAVRREVAEETGLALAAVDYHSSQPWPFPASLMLGFTAQAVDGNAEALDELEAVQWLSREALEAAILQGRLRVSPPLSISHRLIDDWFNPEGGHLAALMTGAAQVRAG